MWQNVILTLFILFAFGLPVAYFYCLFSPCPKYEPMNYEEEVNWLMKDCGLSKEEAEEIANLP